VVAISLCMWCSGGYNYWYNRNSSATISTKYKFNATHSNTAMLVLEVVPTLQK